MNMPTDLFAGCLPALMTPCNDKGVPDFGALARMGRQLCDQGMDGVVYCGSMGDWALLTDEQRCEGVAALVDAGVPVIVGTGAQNTLRAVALVEHARNVGAAGLMVIPRVLSRGASPIAQENHFSALLDAAPDLPAVIYNSPYYGFETRADLFFRLRERHPNLIGFKEFGGGKSLSYAAEYITSGDESLTLMVGVDTQVFHGYVNCGATGAITGVGNALPKEILRLVGLCKRAAAGDARARQLAKELDDALRVLATFDEGPDLVLYYKHLMVLEGHREYAAQLCGSDALSASQKAFLETAWSQFRAWWSSWSGKAG